jgi:hypothetical protein
MSARREHKHSYEDQYERPMGLIYPIKQMLTDIDGAPCARRGGETNNRQCIVIAFRRVTSEKHGHRGVKLNELPTTRTNGRPTVFWGFRMAGLVGVPRWPCVQKRNTWIQLRRAMTKRTVARGARIMSRHSKTHHLDSHTCPVAPERTRRQAQGQQHDQRGQTSHACSRSWR